MTTSIILPFAVLFSGLLMMYTFNSILNSIVKEKISENENPVSVDIVKAVLFLCGGLLISEIVNSFQALTKVLPSSLSGSNLVLKEMMFYSIYFGIALLTLAVILWIGAMTFGITSKGKSIFMEIANNNFNAVVIYCGILLTLTLVVKASLSPLLDEFIPYPTMPTYHG